MRVVLCVWVAAAVLLADAPSRVVQAFSVKLTEAEQRTIAPRHTFYGQTAIDEGRIYEVAPRFSGFVTELKADRSWVDVHKGEPLLSLYSPELVSAMGEYAQSLHLVHEGADAMRQAAKRRLRLLGVDAAAIEAIRAGASAPESYRLLAPASGVVIEKKVNQGSAFSAGQTLYTLADLSRLWVEAEIYQHRLKVLDRIEKATVYLEGHGTFEAAVLDRSPLLDEASQSVTLRLALDNPQGRLQPGLFARVALLEPEREVLFLPASAVMPRGGEYYVFVEGFFEGEYEPRVIGAERIGREGYAIAWGLEPGERVVADALFLFDSDAEINMLY